ncbi:hypothetical protein QO010_002919 [Caulobacter ginsengisoli]|uniref:Lipoprotein n=1 Tax=Caulobacter ginsengisoli TaxID=400775 RepID=A0ABU0IUT1_9CAUL|nr:hypothetical protein [Caulobacter ginsengisoli]MDQ0465135.1 hypothetical protein [Caulobacter ginsengisoli]
MRLLLSVLVLCLAACGPTPKKPPAAPAAPVSLWATVCHDKAGHFAACSADPNEWHECVAADEFGRCPGDSTCFGADNRQLPCESPLAWATVRTNGSWQPDPAVITQLESRVALPRHDHDLTEYRRRYAGVYVEGRKMVAGVYLYPPLDAETSAPVKPDARIVATPGDLPPMLSGGCNVVEVYFDVATGTPASVFCDGPP